MFAGAGFSFSNYTCSDNIGGFTTKIMEMQYFSLLFLQGTVTAEMLGVVGNLHSTMLQI